MYNKHSKCVNIFLEKLMRDKTNEAFSRFKIVFKIFTHMYEILHMKRTESK